MSSLRRIQVLPTTTALHGSFSWHTGALVSGSTWRAMLTESCPLTFLAGVGGSPPPGHADGWCLLLGVLSIRLAALANQQASTCRSADAARLSTAVCEPDQPQPAGEGPPVPAHLAILKMLRCLRELGKVVNGRSEVVCCYYVASSTNVCCMCPNDCSRVCLHSKAAC